jgi:acetoin utilization deacetylase AcuC-like enzyme
VKRLFYCDHHEIPLPPGHRFPKRKYRMLRDLLSSAGVFEFVEAPQADPQTIALAHDPAYVQAFLEGTLDDAAVRRLGFPWSEGLVRRTLGSVGGTLAATREALDTGWGGTLAGGTHHAFPDYGAGFCVFNDFAVAIRSLHLRAAILDLDVHQGDGTAAFFEHDPDVFTLSLHGAYNFPFRKQRSSLDVTFDDGTGDGPYLDALSAALPQVEGFGPRIVFYQSGVDGLREDTLGRLHLSLAGLKQRDQLVFETIRRMGVPAVVTLGGGYADPIERTVEAHAQTFLFAKLNLAP